MEGFHLNDIKKTQHYSKNSLLLDGLKQFIPNVKIVEPFYGEGDLVRDFNVEEYYDISFPEGSEHYRDTLNNPPDYTNKWVITNPPYLAKNKASDKKIFEQYEYDDLYKIALFTLMKAEGGILVIPINFFTDERSKNIRNLFLSTFQIKRLNIYLDQMFESTAYNICSFAFIKKKNTEQIIDTYIYDKEKNIKQISFNLKKEFGYRIGGDFFNSLKKVKNIFSRVTIEKPSNPTHITITCIDKTNEPLHFSYSEEPYYGKQCDRNIATLSTMIEISNEMQIKMIEEGNKIISNFRKSTYDLVFTNYRDRSRKRIGFTEAYQIMSLAYYKILNQGD